MSRTIQIILSVLALMLLLSASALAQEQETEAASPETGETRPQSISASERNKRDRATVDIFLDDERLSVEADIPSVDLVMSYKGTNYESASFKKSFLQKVVDSSKKAPF
ncbi:MAG: hypothetical protein WC966_04915 [Bradymonadales bacterium]|jgi:hypothetical protein